MASKGAKRFDPNSVEHLIRNWDLKHIGNPISHLMEDDELRQVAQELEIDVESIKAYLSSAKTGKHADNEKGILYSQF